MAVREVSDSTFASEVLESDQPVLVDLWAPWCGPCLALAPRVEALSETYGGRVRFTKLNVDDNPATAARYRVMSIPTLLLIRGGELQQTLIGLQPEQRLREALDGLLA